MIQGDHNLGDVGGHFEAALGTLQRDGDALVVPELHATNAADQGAARAHHRIGAGKVGELVDGLGASDQLVDRGARRERTR